MANWLDKYEQGGLVLKQKTKDNYGKKPNPNDVTVSTGPNYVGSGYDIQGRDYSPAWGGRFQMGGSIPGAVGFSYARVAGSAPSNGPYAKKTKASAKDGDVIKDDLGQWAHPGEITEINSPYITMQGVPYPVLGISDTGDTKLMKPGKDYKFKGKKVTEFPIAKNGLRQEQKSLQNLDNLLNFTNYNKPQPGGWLSKYE